MAYVDAVALTPVQAVALSAVSVATLTAVDGSNGNKFSANKHTLLRVKNGSGGSLTVTVHVNYTKEGLALPDKTFTVANSGDVIFSGFSPIFDEATDDLDIDVYVTWSTGTTVTAQVIQPV